MCVYMYIIHNNLGTSAWQAFRATPALTIWAGAACLVARAAHVYYIYVLSIIYTYIYIYIYVYTCITYTHLFIDLFIRYSV